MSEPVKKSRTRRSDAEIEAELARRLAIKRSKAPLKAHRELQKAVAALQAAQDALGEKIVPATLNAINAARAGLLNVLKAVEASIPQEAR